MGSRRIRIPTGVTSLDRELEGGIPTGSIVVLSADPASQAELLLQTISTRDDRETFYITTQRSREAVRDSYTRMPGDPAIPRIQSVDAESPLDSASDLIKRIPEESTVIIDTANTLEEADAMRYRRFINQLQTHMINTGGIAILYSLDGEHVPVNRDISYSMADIVFKLLTRIDGEEVENRLVVPKFRGGSALEQAIKLELTERVSIDTSRDIA